MYRSRRHHLQNRVIQLNIGKIVRWHVGSYVITSLYTNDLGESIDDSTFGVISSPTTAIGYQFCGASDVCRMLERCVCAVIQLMTSSIQLKSSNTESGLVPLGIWIVWRTLTPFPVAASAHFQGRGDELLPLPSAS